MNKNHPNGQDNDNQEDLDLLPFDLDNQEADAQQLISNLSQLNDYEFDHNYILHHLEQLEIDLTLCSNLYSQQVFCLARAFCTGPLQEILLLESN